MLCADPAVARNIVSYYFSLNFLPMSEVNCSRTTNCRAPAAAYRCQVRRKVLLIVLLAAGTVAAAAVAMSLGSYDVSLLDMLQLLAGNERKGVQSATGAAGQNNSFFDSCGLFHGLIGLWVRGSCEYSDKVMSDG